MHKQIVLFFGAFVYYALAFYGLYVFEATLLVSSLVLFGFPAYALAHFSVAPAGILISTVFFGVGISILFEGIAYMFGLWSVSIAENISVFNFISLEVLFAFILQILFLVLLYELIFDDGDYTQSSLMTRITSFAVFAAGSLLLILVFQYLLGDTFLSNVYFYLTGALLTSSIAALAVYRALTVRLFDKLVHFSLIASVPLLISVLLGAANSHKVFDGSVYMGLVTLLNISIPFEELILIFALPFFVATIYELYLDDRM